MISEQNMTLLAATNTVLVQYTPQFKAVSHIVREVKD